MRFIKKNLGMNEMYTCKYTGYMQCCRCHATGQDGVLPVWSNRQQSPAWPVYMRRSWTPVAYTCSWGRQSKLWVEIGAVYNQGKI